MLPYKLSFTSGNVTRFFVLFIVVLLLALGFMVNSAVNSWLTSKRYDMASIAHSMQKRIDTYRFATWQIYENLAASAAGATPGNLQETRLRPDVYYLEKNRRKTEALIFGSHDGNTLDMTQRISDYLDTLWGAENSNWSMYFLNGQDNSLIVISTLPLKDMATRYKETAINNLVDARRAEMLQQATALDERESFSPLRRFTWQNDHYFTLRTTFNQPGHLATVVAFDLPINDLIPATMPLENFQLRQDNSAVNEDDDADDDDEMSNNTHVAFTNPNIEITASLPSTPLQLLYRVSVTNLIADTLRNLLWPLLADFILLILSLAGLFLLRQQSLRPGEHQSAELDSVRMLNEEIVSSLPLGLLVYDFAANRTIISNKIAEHLLPHLNLQKIINMSDQHQGVLQATVNNEVYEIRHARSMIAPQTQLFLMRDQDRELLVNKKLQRAQQILDKNHQIRQQLLQNLGHSLQKPLKLLVEKLQAIAPSRLEETQAQAIDASQGLSRLVDDIVLLNQLEIQDWAPDAASFNLQQLLDALTQEILPSITRKGLQLIVDNQLSSEEMRFGDSRAIHKVLSTLLHYAITTTAWGRISMKISSPAERPDQLVMQIVDTGSGLKEEEIGNTDFPFLGETSADRFGAASGLAFFLCKQLCKQLGGALEIQARPDIGTRYNVTLHAPQEPQQEREEKLLEGVTTLIDIAVEDIRKIVIRLLENWGAICLMPDERLSSQEYDLLLTDDPANLSAWSLLLTDDEPGFTAIGPGQFRVNFNITGAMQDALLQLIEQQLSEEGVTETEEVTSQQIASGYFQLFVDTVPDDVKRLYNEATNEDYSSLALTAHRLKGVFAMLNLTQGKRLCEILEQHIKACDTSNIENTTSQIDQYVNELLQQGNQ
ncbi:phosphotransferase RcsD [Erwinia sp. OLTSP20]|uniref:phosphotransferase RcsD n=1 Tax=unclassified Erwinia TaxID=2622719 RepID=UPI000C17F237|nr:MULTISPECIES: phosphotransferase RcsD [unclassified Erwinia]PIJ50076.1 phosphotransferase RcsD [Erwinia sp. OAMSP11]PIJ71946.1 phosphotransferase RcsD [Erwinia sp. OLSSP12]PIJ80928.1 phosphotransferase RcsD [Erwinia sp. OLCASP19]PIJ83833.1 phosphotransferase RcsD [Erwinia sp. OLMTSP26]PIJ85991.1 phosphotransferase RcsD [Erwinia sp. OLMDSP33]